MKLKQLCPICSKPLILKSELNLGHETIKTFTCGHTFANEALVIDETRLDFISVTGDKKARNYQEEGIEFILKSGFGCIIGDQMRLGKTPQSLLALKNAPERMPCLIIPRATNIFQWIEEFKTWTSSLPLGIYPILGSTGFIPGGFNAYIISMDTFSRRGTCKSCKHQFHNEECKRRGCNCRVCVPNGDSMVAKLLKFGFKSVIVDEAHSMKDPSSLRTKALISFLSEISQVDTTYEVPFNCIFCQHSWIKTVVKHETSKSETVNFNDYCPSCNAYVIATAQKEKINTERKCGIIFLTGTAIKNRAEELFVPLNICAPEVFPSLALFRKRWLMQDQKGAYSRVRPGRYEQFRATIAPYYLRREKEDVYTDLPALNRMFTMVEIADEKLRKAYNDQLDVIERMSMSGSLKYFDTIGELVKLRMICGMAKIDYCVDYVEELLGDSEKMKLAIGVHHHIVRDTIKFRLSQYGVTTLSGEDPPEMKFRIMKNFETSPEQILDIGMLAGGLGMDFHYVDRVLVLERQWSAADEEQFEFRFYNPDTSIKNRPTDIEYPVAKGTIDEFFYDLVEYKRKIFGETIGTHWDLSQDQDSFKNLVERTLAARL